MQNVYDGSGRIIATVLTSGPISTITDGQGRGIGYSTANGTFRSNGTRVSLQPMQIGLLLTDSSR